MQRICVFIGASYGKGAKYTANTVALAKQIVEKKLGLVYGGAKVGLMGQLANTVLSCGGEVVGVIPKSLMIQEIPHRGLTELHVVESMLERKAMMFKLSDAFIALPGGLGMLEETFEVWNAIKIGVHKKPLGLLNVDGYFNPLLQFLKKASEEGFINQEQLDLILVKEDPVSLLDSINTVLSGTSFKNQGIRTPAI